MKQSTKTILLFLVVTAVTAVVIKSQKPAEKIDLDTFNDLPKETRYYARSEPLKCILEKVVVEGRGSDSSLLQGSNYLKTWVVDFKNIKNKAKQAYLITSSEDPWQKGQEFFVSTNCIELSDLEKESFKKQAEDSCTGLYLWDKENYQITRECGYVINDQPVFFNFKKASNF